MTMRGTGRGRPIDETGNVYGKLRVLGPGQKKGKYAPKFWLCQCECGRTTNTRGFSLRRGQALSCGCVRREVFKSRNTLPNGEAAMNRAISNIRGNAHKRRIPWEISLDTARSLITKNCHYRGRPPHQVSRGRNGNFMYNGIDRVDNSAGYITGNVVPCCGTCNFAKLGMSLAEFMDWVDRVHGHLFGPA